MGNQQPRPASDKNESLATEWCVPPGWSHPQKLIYWHNQESDDAEAPTNGPAISRRSSLPLPMDGDGRCAQWPDTEAAAAAATSLVLQFGVVRYQKRSIYWLEFPVSTAVLRWMNGWMEASPLFLLDALMERTPSTAWLLAYCMHRTISVANVSCMWRALLLSSSAENCERINSKSYVRTLNLFWVLKMDAIWGEAFAERGLWNGLDLRWIQLGGWQIKWISLWRLCKQSYIFLILK